MPFHRPPHPPSGGTIVIVGGGATGALTAVELAEAGFHVTLVEKARIGNGSSQRSAAAIRAQFGTPETALGMAYSERWYVDFHDHLHTCVDERSPVITQNGYLWLYEDPQFAARWDHKLTESRTKAWKRAQAGAQMQRLVGLPVETLDADEVVARWPHLNGDSAGGIIGATWCPTDGFLIPDQVYLHGVRWARELGATVREGTEVIGSEVVGGKIVGLIVRQGTERQVIGCDAVINCTNAWAPRFSRTVGGMDLPIEVLKRYLGFVPHTDAIDEATWKKLPFTIYGDGFVYSRPDGGTLMIGCAHETPPANGFTDEDQDRVEPGFGHNDRSSGVPYVAHLRERVGGFAPGLVEANLTATTCGFYGSTPDHNPLIGWDKQLDGLMHCAGFSGHGLMHAPISALIVRALATGEVGKAWRNTTDPETGEVVKRELRPSVRLPGYDQVLFLDRFAPDREFTQGEHAVL